jgi:large subunit ribosomal protein L31e
LAQAADKAIGDRVPEERIYVIPLRAAKRVPKRKRSARAARVVREFLRQHMKSEQIKLDEALNRKLWERGAEKIPSRVRVRAVKQDDGSVEASLVG